MWSRCITSVSLSSTELIEFWLQSIHFYTEKEGMVILVGTHADKLPQVIGLTLSHMQTLSVASAVDDFWKHNEQFLLLPLCFQLFSIIKLSLTEIFYKFVLDVFKVICSRFVVCGKGLRIWATFDWSHLFACADQWKLRRSAHFWLSLHSLHTNVDVPFIYYK